MGTSVIDNESFMRIQQGTSMVCVKFRGRHWAWTQHDVMLKHRGLARGGPMSRPSSQGVHKDIHGNHVVRGLWGKRRSFPRLALAEPDYKEKLAQLSSEKRPRYIEGFEVSTASYSHEWITKLVGWGFRLSRKELPWLSRMIRFFAIVLEVTVKPSQDVMQSRDAAICSPRS